MGSGLSVTVDAQALERIPRPPWADDLQIQVAYLGGGSRLHVYFGTPEDDGIWRTACSHGDGWVSTNESIERRLPEEGMKPDCRRCMKALGIDPGDSIWKPGFTRNPDDRHRRIVELETLLREFDAGSNYCPRCGPSYTGYHGLACPVGKVLGPRRQVEGETP